MYTRYYCTHVDCLGVTLNPISHGENSQMKSYFLCWEDYDPCISTNNGSYAIVKTISWFVITVIKLPWFVTLEAYWNTRIIHLSFIHFSCTLVVLQRNLHKSIIFGNHNLAKPSMVSIMIVVGSNKLLG